MKGTVRVNMSKRDKKTGAKAYGPMLPRSSLYRGRNINKPGFGHAHYKEQNIYLRII